MTEFSEFSDSIDEDFLLREPCLRDTLLLISNTSLEKKLIIRKNSANEYYFDLCEHNLNLQGYSICVKNRLFNYEVLLIKKENENEENLLHVCYLDKNTFTNMISIKSYDKNVGEFMVKKYPFLKNTTEVDGYINSMRKNRICLRTKYNPKKIGDEFSTKNAILFQKKPLRKVLSIYKNGPNFLSVTYQYPLNLINSFLTALVIIL